MNRDFYSVLSKAVSYALRHEPWLYELELDNEGWAPIESLLLALRKAYPEWLHLQRSDLEKMIANSSKRRHEIKDDKIRALYGHSLTGRLKKEIATPPVVLFHGTGPEVLEKIKKEGLKPMCRQYVHMSTTVELAREVGLRKAKHPVILKIDAIKAYSAGVNFYEGNDKVWLADYVPSEFVSTLL